MSAGRIWNPSAFRPSPSPCLGTEFTCALCGARFTHGGETCGACPLAAGCDLVRCPACGYQFPRRSSLVDAWRRLSARFRRSH
jgi:hypothetical protein